MLISFVFPLFALRFRLLLIVQFLQFPLHSRMVCGEGGRRAFWPKNIELIKIQKFNDFHLVFYLKIFGIKFALKLALLLHHCHFAIPRMVGVDDVGPWQQSHNSRCYAPDAMWSCSSVDLAWNCCYGCLKKRL